MNKKFEMFETKNECVFFINNDINGKLHTFGNKCINVIKDVWGFNEIIDTAPDDVCINFLNTDVIRVSELTIVPPFKKIIFDTSNIIDFTGSFSYFDFESNKYMPYQYDLDWVYIKKGACINDMFEHTKFNKKLPKMEENMPFDEFVKTTGLIVTPELFKNNNISVDTWCKNKHNQKLMRSNKQYEPMLEYWLNSDFITTEEKIEAMEKSGIEIFEV